MRKQTTDLIGKKYGKLTVIAIDKTVTGKGSKVICNCDCGTKNIPVDRSNLVRGHTKSCGCIKEQWRKSVLKDLTGQKFGKLTVVERCGKKGKTYWLCDCDCGSKGIIASSSDLKTGDKVSCGCIRKQYIKEKDLTGLKFGRLTVIEKSTRRSKNGDVYYVCNCDCGTKGIEVVRSSLVAKDSHKQVSCGCWVKEGNNITNRHENREEAIVVYLYGKLKQRNKKLNYGTEIISIEEYKKLIKAPCVYCGLKDSDVTKESLFYSYKKDRVGKSNHIDYDFEIHHNGIDRIDSSKGYIVGNVVPCCKFCNIAKSDYDRDDFLNWAEVVYEHFAKHTEQ